MKYLKTYEEIAPGIQIWISKTTLPVIQKKGVIQKFKGFVNNIGYKVMNKIHPGNLMR